MRLERLRQIPGRVRLAYQLLREYEAEQEPRSWEENMAILRSFPEAVDSENWEVTTRRVGAESWREAVLAKASSYPAGNGTE